MRTFPAQQSSKKHGFTLIPKPWWSSTSSGCLPPSRFLIFMIARDSSRFANHPPNLGKIEGGHEQWAFENSKTDGTPWTRP